MIGLVFLLTLYLPVNPVQALILGVDWLKWKKLRSIAKTRCRKRLGRFLGRFKEWAGAVLSNRSMPDLKHIDNLCIYMNSELSVCLGPQINLTRLT
jgi:hypothetical protein